MDAEKILEDSAKKNMIEWNQKEFSKTHPKLYKTIIESINKALNIIDVNQQKELLQYFCKLVNITHDTVNKDIEDVIEKQKE